MDARSTTFLAAVLGEAVRLRSIRPHSGRRAWIYSRAGVRVVGQPAARESVACFVGVFVGTLIGVLPGIGPVATMSLLLPITFAMSPTASIIMMAGIYYGAMYGGSTTSILVNIPGEAASVVTCIDGYQMARQGRAGPALGIAAFGSFIAGTFSVVGIMLLAPPLTSVALRFGPPEIFGLLLLGFTMVTYLTAGSKLKAVAMALLGMLLGTIGLDPITGLAALHLRQHHARRRARARADHHGPVRHQRGAPQHRAGRHAGGVRHADQGPPADPRGLEALRPRPSRAAACSASSSASCPASASIIPTFISYALEKRLSRTPERFGKGAIEGVAGPEAANNAATGGAHDPAPHARRSRRTW